MHDRQKRRDARSTGDRIEGVTRAIGEVGVSGGDAGELPYRDVLQGAFGKHDLSGVRASVAGRGGAAAEAIGAEAYAYGDRIAFRDSPSLSLAAHEAAHHVQHQRGAGVPGRVGAAGDPLERNADRVAEAVTAGRSAEGLLDQVPQGSAAAGPAVQRTMIGGYQSASPGARGQIEAYLRDSRRSYDELQRIRGQLLVDQHPSFETWVSIIDEVLVHWQVDQVKGLGTQRNYATSMMYTDNNLSYVQQQPVMSGTGTSEFSQPQGLMETPDVEVSSRDSEVMILPRLLQVFERIQPPPSSVVLKLVSTNGACDACKGRLATLAQMMIEALRQRGWTYECNIKIQYRYLKKPKRTDRTLGGRNQGNGVEVPTTYGSLTDQRQRLPTNEQVYENVTNHNYDPVGEGSLVEMGESMDLENDPYEDDVDMGEAMELEETVVTYRTTG